MSKYKGNYGRTKDLGDCLLPSNLGFVFSIMGFPALGSRLQYIHKNITTATSIRNTTAPITAPMTTIDELSTGVSEVTTSGSTTAIKTIKY